MPATITHAYFAEDLFNLLDKKTENKVRKSGEIVVEIIA